MIGEHAGEAVDHDGDDVEADGELLDGLGEELLGARPFAAGGGERADERGLGREVPDEGVKPPEVYLGVVGPVERLGELDAVEALEVGLELAPALV